MRKTDCNSLRMQVIRAYRLGRDGEGSSILARFVDCMFLELKNCQAVITDKEIKILDEIFSAQKRSDYIFIADLLEYKLFTTGFVKIASICQKK